MKVKVVNEFVDKHTGELHRKGSSFDCDETRLKEIEKAGFFVVVEPAKEKKKAEVIEKVTEE